jgi:DNA mismatch endonuclease (patch repair protein)
MRGNLNNESTYLRDGRAPIPTREITSKVMRSNKAKNTKPEKIFRKALWQAGLRGYRLNVKNIPGKPDIAFLGRKIAIFINGCFWHRCDLCQPNFPKSNVEFWKNKFEKNKERDQRKIEELCKLNWKVLTIWECEIQTKLDSLVQMVKLMQF